MGKIKEWYMAMQEAERMTGGYTEYAHIMNTSIEQPTEKTNKQQTVKNGNEKISTNKD